MLRHAKGAVVIRGTLRNPRTLCSRQGGVGSYVKAVCGGGLVVSDSQDVRFPTRCACRTCAGLYESSPRERGRVREKARVKAKEPLLPCIVYILYIVCIYTYRRLLYYILYTILSILSILYTIHYTIYKYYILYTILYSIYCIDIPQTLDERRR